MLWLLLVPIFLGVLLASFLLLRRGAAPTSVYDPLEIDEERLRTLVLILRSELTEHGRATRRLSADVQHSGDVFNSRLERLEAAVSLLRMRDVLDSFTADEDAHQIGEKT
jgi:hypothetical protein